ncbi:MAG: nodulation protein NfeD [Nitrospiraceae bacterium]|nr:nodulation protein NfeD [Nitrospiraceae bacterium]
MRGSTHTVSPALLLAYSLLVSSFVSLESPAALGQAREVYVATYEGVINPVAAEYIHEAIDSAQAAHAEALILRLDTPGGLDTSMRVIIKDITSASIPVVVYVAPSGGRAASAGVFITLAGHVAAMAPGTNIGAAHPVALGGGDLDKTMKEKLENDAVAYIKSTADQHGRNASWAEDAVLKSRSATEKEALKLKVIELVAEDVPTLLAQLDHRSVKLGNETRALNTAGATQREFPMGLRLEALKALSDPNIAYILMTLGTVGLIAELYSPGAILPGIVGAISLILAFYSFQSLPIDYAGLLLLVLGVIFFVLEATVTSYGLLALGGVISMLLGSLMLIKTDAQFLQLSWSVIFPVIGLAAVGSLLMVGMGLRALRRMPATGQEELVGLVGIAKTAISPHGHLAIHGELWDAISDSALQPGDHARVTHVEGLTLHVQPVARKDGASCS